MFSDGALASNVAPSLLKENCLASRIKGPFIGEDKSSERYSRYKTLGFMPIALAALTLSNSFGIISPKSPKSIFIEKSKSPTSLCAVILTG
jgi:hypothetical protein